MIANWIYHNREVSESDIEKQYGFVYLITNRINGRKYIGRKYLSKAGYRIINGKRKKIRKDSDWRTYFGSSEELKKDIIEYGIDNFSREILHFCRTRGHTNYLELKEIVNQCALETNNYYNSWVSARIHKTHLKNLA